MVKSQIEQIVKMVRHCLGISYQNFGEKTYYTFIPIHNLEKIRNAIFILNINKFT